MEVAHDAQPRVVTAGREDMRLHATSCAFSCALITLAAGTSHAAVHVYPVNATATSSTLMSSGDRCLDRLSFFGATNTFTDADLTRFASGALTDATGSFNWNTSVQRGLGQKSKLWAVTPDRADVATRLSGEPAATGSLGEIFGDSLGYKNLSWAIDGKSKRTYTLDLVLSRDNYFTPDNDPKTVELAFLERGGDSDVAIYGITGYDDSGAPLLTDPIIVNRKQTTATGWSIDTLRARKAQRVEGAGLSLPSEWGTVIGVRLENQKKFNGADIVGVAMIPTPGAAALFTLAGLTTIRRHRRA